MPIRIDRDVCASAGMCALTAPDRFDQDEEDGRVIMVGPSEFGDDESVRTAAELCPSGAIRID